jgi:hypothetical protein
MGAQSGKHVVSFTQTQRGPPPPGVTRQKQPPASHNGKHRSGLAPGHGAPASVNSSHMEEGPSLGPSIGIVEVESAPPSFVVAASSPPQPAGTAAAASPPAAASLARRTKRLIAPARYPALTARGTLLGSTGRCCCAGVAADPVIARRRVPVRALSRRPDLSERRRGRCRSPRAVTSPPVALEGVAPRAVHTPLRRTQCPESFVCSRRSSCWRSASARRTPSAHGSRP